MGKKYIIEFDDEPINDAGTLWKAKGFNSLVFDQNGLNKLTPYEESSAEKEAKEFPRKGNKYYYIEPDGSISCTYFTKTKADLNALEIGNVFKDYREAYHAVERLKAMEWLKQFVERKRRSER